MAAYRQARDAEPATGEPRIRIVGLHLLQGRPADAEREARDFLLHAPTAEAHATLGQVLRLSGREVEAIESYVAAHTLSPTPALRALLNDARRSAYWCPNGDEWAALAAKEHPTDAERYRFLHLRLLGLLSPEVQAWIIRIAPDQETLPPALARRLDAEFGGRFSKELKEVSSLSDSLRREGAVGAARARVTTTSGVAEGLLIDSDAAILGALEVVEEERYGLVPFGEIRRLTIASRGNYFTARMVRRGGRESTVEIPALYYYTEWCRDPQAREGRVTVWKALTKRLRLGIGLRDFVIGDEKLQLFGIDTVEAIEFA